MASTLCVLDPRWRDPVFSVASREYTWLDVFLGAMVRGEWQAFERRLVEGLACLAEAASSQAWPQDARLEEAATAFRSERDLLSRADTLAWLERTGLSLEAWTDYLMRQLLRADRTADLDHLVARRRERVDVTADAFAADGICSGQFDAYARTLAGRAAVVARHGPSSAVDPTDRSELERLQATLAVALRPFEPADLASRLADVRAIESGFQAHARDAVTSQSLAAQVALNPLEWMRLDLERVSFDRIDAAREAVCCIRQDGLSLSDVAVRSRQAIRDTSTLLERVEPELRDAVLGGAIDELIGPVAVDGRFELMTITGKAAPDVSDALVRARAEEAVVEHLVSSATLAHVRWVDRP